MKDEWVTLGDVITPRREKGLPSNHPELPYIGLEHVEAHTMQLLGTVPAGTMRSNANRFYAGDVLYGRLRPYLNKVYSPTFGGYCSAEFIVFPKSEWIDSAFLKHRLNARDFVSFASHLNAGDRPRVDFDQLSSFAFILPSYLSQRRIVGKIEDLFSELDSGIASLKTAREQLKVYRQALLKHAFEGKLTENWRKENPDKLESAETLLSRIQQEREDRYRQQLADWEAGGPACRQAGKPKAPNPLPPLTAEELAELPELPEGWGWATLEHIQSHDKYAVKAGPFGSALKKEYYVQDGYKIYGQEQVIRNDHGYGDYFIDEQKYSELYSCAIKPFDVLISLVGTIGKVLVLPETAKPGIINPRLVKISLNLDCYLPSFFKAYFESGFLRSLYANESQGTTMDILNLGMIQRLPYPLCSVAEQEKILEILEEKFSQADQLEQTLAASLQQAEALRQSILKKAFSGRLVPQDPNDLPATELLARIKAERERKPVKSRKSSVGDNLSPTELFPASTCKDP